MNDWSNTEKKDFIKDKDIPVYESAEFTLDKILKFSLVKDTINLDCFGYCDEDSKVCRKCFLFSNGYCKEFSKYLAQFDGISESDSITIVEWHDNKKEYKIMSLDHSLEKLGFKSKKSASYRIAKVILESADKPYGDVIKKIAGIMKGTTHAAQIRFYQTRKRIEDRLGLKVLIITTKYIQIKDTNAGNK
jgi:hypothetical protein